LAKRRDWAGELERPRARCCTGRLYCGGEIPIPGPAEPLDQSLLPLVAAMDRSAGISHAMGLAPLRSTQPSFKGSLRDGQGWTRMDKGNGQPCPARCQVDKRGSAPDRRPDRCIFPAPDFFTICLLANWRDWNQPPFRLGHGHPRHSRVFCRKCSLPCLGQFHRAFPACSLACLANSASPSTACLAPEFLRF
jgi:hypothetical protein